MSVRHSVKVYEYHKRVALRREALPIVAELVFDGPALEKTPDGVRGDVDELLRLARAAVALRFPRRKLRGLSALAGGGFAAILGDQE